ncbi:MAG: hypothetical protein IKQ97_05365 [Eubacterium sp.]|nr:hypothetical protein [Eubacterium sp.]
MGYAVKRNHRFSHRRSRLAMLLVLSLILSMTGGSRVAAAKKAPTFSHEKKTLIAGSAFRLKIRKNGIDKIISTKWSVNTNASSVLTLSETSGKFAVVSTEKGSQVPRFKARVTAKVDYQAGKKLKRKKLVCVVTVKSTAATVTSAPVITPEPATPTQAPSKTTAPAVSPTVPAATVTPPVVPTTTPTASVSPSPGTMSSLNVVESYTKYYVERESYHTCLSVGFNKAYSHILNYDTTPSPVPGQVQDAGYWVKNAKSVAQVFRENGSNLQEVAVTRVIRPDVNKYPNQVIIDLGTARYEGNYRVYLRGFRASGTTESAEDRVFSLKLSLQDIVSTYSSFRMVDRFSEPTMTHNVTITLRNWSVPVRDTSGSMISQAELIKHVKVLSGYGETLVVQNAFTDPKENTIILYVKGGTNSTIFRVSFDEIAPYLFWDCSSEGVYTAKSIFEVSVNEQI